MTKDEALKLALEALEDLGMKLFESTGEVLYKDTFTAIKEALAQQEPEYLAFMDTPQRKPLTDEQARFEFEAWHKDAYTQSLQRYGHTYKNHHTRCRWQGWLAAHGIKGEA